MNKTTLRRLSGLLAPAAALTAALAFCSAAQAVTFDFASATDYSNNFQRTFLTSGSGNTLTTTGGAIVHSASGSGTSISVYDTAPDTTITNTFTNVTVEFDFSTTVNNSSVGVYFGNSTRTNANLALFNLNNATNQDQLRIFGGRDWNLATGVNGSTTSPAFNQTLSTGGWTVNKTYHALFTISYTGATTADVTFTISDPYTGIGALSSFSGTATGLTVAANGEIGLRTGFAGGGGSVTIDNVSITTAAVPEPSAFAALGGLAVLGFAATRRRQLRA